MNKNFFIVAFLLISLLMSIPSLSQEFTKSTEFRGLRMTYADFFEILDKMSDLVSTSNNDSIVNATTNSLTVENKEDKVKVKPLDESAVTFLPDIGYKLSYEFYDRERPISEIHLSFSDNSRTISVAGYRPEQVQALFAYLEREFEARTTNFGGLGFRILLSISITVFAVIFLIVSLPKKDGLVEISSRVFFNPRIIFACILWLAATIGQFFPFYESLFPGFAIYSGEVSFIRRNAAELSVFIGFVSISISLYFGLRRKMNGEVRD